MRIVCQQTILMKHHALFVICYFCKSSKIWNCRLLQIIGGAFQIRFYYNWTISRAEIANSDGPCVMLESVSCIAEALPGHGGYVLPCFPKLKKKLLMYPVLNIVLVSLRIWPLFSYFPEINAILPCFSKTSERSSLLIIVLATVSQMCQFCLTSFPF